MAYSPTASVYKKQIDAALLNSANFGNNGGYSDVRDQEAIDYLSAAFDTKFRAFLPLCSFNTAGEDNSTGHGNLFHIFMRLYDSDKATGKYGTANSIDTMIDTVQGIFQGAGVKGYIINVDYASQTADIVVRYDPYTSNVELNDISQHYVDNKDGTDNPEQQAEAGGAKKGIPDQGAFSTTDNFQYAGPPELADPPSSEAKMTVNLSSRDTSEFYKDCVVLLEGVAVPYNTITISYGIGQPASCSIILPAHKVLRDLPDCTKVHIFFKDLLPDSSGEYKYRLLFDGEKTGHTYNTTASGAYMQIQAMHSCAYTTMMQLMTLDAAQYLFNPSARMAGESTIPILVGMNRMHATMIESLISGSFESMADIVYQMMRGILEGNDQTATGKYYASKLGNGEGAWKIMKRIYGVSKKTAASKAPTTNWSKEVANGNSGSSGGGGGDTSNNTFSYAGTGNMQRPTAGTVTSPFGNRIDPFSGESQFHSGIDVGNDEGTPIYAAENGVVDYSGEYNGYGNYIRINHGGGIATCYAHMSTLSVGSGANVVKGQVIGAMGSTGKSTGPHLHFEVLVNGEPQDPLNYIGGS